MASMVPWGGGGMRAGYDPFSWDVWDPLDSAFGAAGGPGSWLWDTAARRGGERDDTAALARTRVDWRETDDAHIFHADLPGVRKEEVKVQVEDGNILQISGERSREEEDSTDTWHRVERRKGSFLRRFRLPEDANMDAVRCSLEHGVLEITVPKLEVEKPAKNVRAIDIQ